MRVSGVRDVRPVPPEIAVQLGRLAVEHHHEDLARVFRAYLSQRIDYSSLEVVSQPQIDAKITRNVAAIGGYSRIAREHIERVMNELKEPAPDFDAIKMFAHVVQTAIEHQAKALEDLSKVLLEEKKD